MKRFSDNPIQVAMDHLHHGICLFDPDGRVLTMNRRFAEMYNPSVDPSKTLRDYLRDGKAAGVLPGDPDEIASFLMEAMRQGRTLQMMHEYPDGRIMSVTDTPTGDGGFLSTHEDVTDRVRAERQIAHMAKHDLLTDLANRAAFRDEIARAVAEGEARHEQFAVVYIDLDRFKEINDVFGHSVGDELLRELSGRMRKAAEGAFVARLGGDEFAIIQRGPQPDAATALAERLQNDVAGEIRVGGRILQAGFSIGIAVYPQDGLDAAVLINRADAAMYRAKSAGRCRVRFFEPEMDEALRDRRALESELHHVVQGNQLLLHYQPQATVDGTVTGFEALVRWQHPTRGTLLPGSFIHLAEQNGTIVEIGEWVLREACREAASWDRPFSVAVNLSPVQFRLCDLPKLVAGVLAETSLEPERLELELTETTLLEDYAQALVVLRALKALGVRIAMDDFGTGFSSLSYLRSFPFDKIKIDRSFIADLSQNETAEAIVRGVISLARGLNMPVIAEGVETNDQLDFLARETCQAVQGFLIGRPCPIGEYAELFAGAKGLEAA
jgi:diguanylate cyclase (GGDEF)-like protein